jgi:glycosyltransferase involved in cell wall biosynthesis
MSLEKLEKIVFTRFPLESAWGGEEALHLALAQELRSRGVEVAFVGSCPVFREEFEQQGFRTFFFPFIRDITSKKMLLLSPILIFLMTILGVFFFLYLKRKGYTTLVFLTYIEKIAWTPLAKIFGFRIFWSHHAPLGKWFFQNPYRFFWKIFSQTTPSIVPSYFLSHAIKEAFPRAKTYVLPNALLPNRNFLSLKRTPDKRESFRKYFSLPPFPKDIVLIGSMGRLSREKGVEDLLEAIILLKHLPLQFFIAGKGHLQSSLYKTVQKEGLQKKVHFLGFLDEEAMKEFFSGIDIFVLPSRQETFGMAALEAMSAGLPIIATKAGGIPEVVQEKKTGILVPERNSRALAEAIQKLSQQPKKQKSMGNEGRETVKNLFSIEMYTDRAIHFLLKNVPTKSIEKTVTHRKQKILWLENGDFLGGAERFSLDMLESKQRKNFEVLLLYGGESKDFLASLSQISQENFSHQRVALPPFRKFDRKGISLFLKTIFSLRERVSLEKIQLIHANTARGIMLVGAMMYFWKNKIQFTAFAHDFTIPKWAVKLFLSKANQIFACSDLVKKDLIEKGILKEKILVFPNGVSENLFDILDPHFPENKYKIGIIGRIDKWKGQDTFLLAAAKVWERFPDTEFFIIGSSSSHDPKTVDFESSLRKSIQAESFGRSVHFTGFLPTREALSQLDVVVHAPSEPEPFGRVPIEAAAAGRALIISDTGTPPKIFSNRENALFFMPGNADELAEKMIELLQKPFFAKYLGKNGRIFVDQYRLSLIAPKFFKRIQKILRREE